MTEIDVDCVTLESHRDPRYSVSKKRRKIMPQHLRSTTASCTKRMVANFTRKINYFRLARVSKTRVKLKVL